MEGKLVNQALVGSDKINRPSLGQRSVLGGSLRCEFFAAMDNGERRGTDFD
jgi:hypothetical protein